MQISQISIFVENKSGRLCEITGILKDAGVDIRALSIADTTNFGILRLIVSDPAAAEAALKKGGFTVNTTQVIGVHVADQPGSLHNVLQVLNDSDIGVEYAYAFITRTKDDAFVILRVEDNEKAVEVLQNAGVKVISASEVYEL